jgi:WD repeat-containing protein 68
MAEAQQEEKYTFTPDVKTEPSWKEVFACNWSQKPGQFRLAVGSFVEEYNNKIKLVKLDQEKSKLVEFAQIEHPYPATKIVWIPDLQNRYPDLLATTGDYLRLWKIQEGQAGGKSEVKMETVLNNNKSSEFCAPLTSFDWCTDNPRYIGTSSIDTTCTIWDIEVGKQVAMTPEDAVVKTQLIAHDQEVYDIAFKPGDQNMFCSVGADGSVRMFDLRSLKHSRIMYEDKEGTPLLRLAWNSIESNFLATMKMGSSEVNILDIRAPCDPLMTLQPGKGPGSNVNGIAWAPNSACHLCTAGEDKKALIWDISQAKREAPQALEPCLAYDVKTEAGSINPKGQINQVHWSAVSPEWISICYNNTLEVLRV